MEKESTLFTLRSWPRAILHVDGDAFFASCEEAMHPELKGKTIITGAERGIVACASYAAKKKGVKRGIPLRQARLLCPGLIVLPSDYESYSLFSRRMFSVIRRFTPQVEEYSIDEAFADITGMRRALHASYEAIAGRVKEEIKREVGVGVSVGLSITKVLAKVASKHRKPDGLTVISGRAIAPYLQDLPCGAIWGIGPATTAYLEKLGVRTALQFACLSERTVEKRLTKPGREIWRELRGESVYPVSAEERSARFSISRTRTFAPPTSEPEYLFAHLMRNLEAACLKARRYGLAPRNITSILRKQDFDSTTGEMRLDRPSSYPLELSESLRELFGLLYRSGTLYRATSVVLTELAPARPMQYSLFDDSGTVEKVEELYRAVDDLNGRYGKHTLHLGGSHAIEVKGKGRRGDPTAREETVLSGERGRRRLGIPVLHVRVR